MKTSIFLLALFLPIIIFGQSLNKIKPFDISWQYIGSPNFSPDSVVFPNLCISTNEVPYVAFRKVYDPFTVYVMKFNRVGWENVGPVGSIQGWISRTSLAIDDNGVPCMAFQSNNLQKISVKKFINGSWINVGSPEFSPSITSTINLVINPQGIPFVAFVDFISSKATVMKYNGTTWVYVGNSNFSPVTTAANLAFSATGELFIACLDELNSFRINIMKFDGNNWNSFGPSGPIFSSSTSDISIAIGPDGLPYIPYPDKNAGNKLTVSKNDGSEWSNVGPSLFSTTGVSQMILTFDQSGIPYVACNDSLSASVFSFNGSIWNSVGEHYFSDGYINSLCFTLSPSGKPVCGFIGQSSRKLSVMNFGSPLSIQESYKDNMMVYPNPATDHATLQFENGGFLARRIYIYNSLGGIVDFQTTNGNSLNMDVSDYPPGIYFVKMEAGGVVCSTRFCKL